MTDLVAEPNLTYVREGCEACSKLGDSRQEHLAAEGRQEGPRQQFW